MKIKRNKNYVIIYHDNCSDGFTAAAIAQLFFSYNTDLNCKVEYVPGKHGQSLDSSINLKDKIVMFLDFTYPLEELKTIINQSEAVYFLDHHVTGINNIKTLDKDSDYCVKIFNFSSMEKSGARIAWDFFSSEDTSKKFGNSIPKTVTYVENRDLWKLTDETVYYLTSLEKDGISIDLYKNEINSYIANHYLDYQDRIQHHITHGKVLREYFNSLVKKQMSKVSYASFNSYQNIPIINCSTFEFVSDLGNLIAQEHPDTFVILYNIDNLKDVKLSFRSIKFDTTLVAKLFGGGGHKNASGACLSVTDFFKTFNISEKPPAIPTYEYEEELADVIDKLFSVINLEKYEFTSHYIDDYLLDITINLLQDLSILLGRDPEEDEPYCFEQEDGIIYVYNYDTKIHSDINLIYKIEGY